MPSRRIASIFTLATLPCFAAHAAPPVAPVTARPFELETVVVSADRLPSDATNEPFSGTVIDREQILRAPQLRLDDVLRNASPGFSLFRRNSSRVANPTAQGVSLRNLGPNGAGRTLVLLDGIPLNDPFAGWVPWARVPPSSLGEVLVNPGGGAGLFGNAALGGTIHLLSPRTTGNSGRILGTIGNRDTYDASLEARLEAGNVALSTFLNRFSTAGYPVLQANQRGPVDTSADADSWVWQNQLAWQINADTRLTLGTGAFEEDRHNGTRFTKNSTNGQDFNATLDRRFAEWDAELRLQAYAQRRQFSSTFSSVNPDRTEETPALDQFDVPATAVGGSAVWSQQLGEKHRLIGGVDARWVEGETNELFRWMDGGYTRARNAGGRQLLVGAFLEENWRPTNILKFVAGARLDYWQQSGGRRAERDRVTGAALQDTTFPDQDGLAPNFRLGVSADVSKSVRLRGAAYTGFRIPTLNELYRPFRVGNDITEANASLEPEHLVGAELGFDWKPTDSFSLTVTGFYNQLRDAIGNVTIGQGPGTFEPGGFVPAGGILRQRRNLDEVEVAGVETSLLWSFAPQWTLRAQYLYTHPTVTRASAARELEGNLLAQAPEHVAVVALGWTPDRWQLAAQARYTDRQFEDDQNTLPLAPFVTVDASIGYQFTSQFWGSFKVENLFDTEYEIGKTGSGLVSIGAPRLFSLTLGYDF